MMLAKNAAGIGPDIKARRKDLLSECFDETVANQQSTLASMLCLNSSVINELESLSDMVANVAKEDFPVNSSS